MTVIKNQKSNTYEVRTYYKDWTGVRKQKTKRGFKRKCDAQEWERAFKLKENLSLDMYFEDFVDLYLNDIKSRIKYNTWLTKKHIVEKKILPYFSKKKLQEIKPFDIRQWQNTMMNYRNKQGERLLNNISINEILYDCSLEKYKNGTYVETLEQNMTRKNLMKSNGDVCFIAPTSSGKSSIISNHIKNNEANKKSLVIVYIDLRTKTDEELVNLLIIKTKIEQDFLSYQYLRAVSFLRDVKIISKDEFNIEIYGTADETKIDLLKLGITAGLLKILNSENQIKNIEKDQYGNIQGNAELKRFYMTSDDYTKFEIEKYIRIN